MTYSIDFVKHILRIYKNKNKQNTMIKDILETANIARSTLYEWVNKSDTLINCKKRNKILRNKNIKVSEKCSNMIINYMSQNKNHSSIKKLKKIIKRTCKINISKSHIYNVLKDNKITNKKIQEDHCPYSDKVLKEKLIIVKNQVDNANGNVIYIDESSVEISIKKKYGWSKKGKRCVIKNTCGKHFRVSLLLAITKYGCLDYSIKKGTFNAKTFRKFLKYKLKNGLGCKFFMDNAKIHHAKILEQDLKDNIIYNVPYHSELNPIEMVFNTLKSYLKTINVNSVKTIRKHMNIFMSQINKISLEKYVQTSYNMMLELTKKLENV